VQLEGARAAGRSEAVRPLYRARRLLTKARERLDEKGEVRLVGLLRTGDPHREVQTAWQAKEVVRSIYEIDDPATANECPTLRRPTQLGTTPECHTPL